MASMLPYVSLVNDVTIRTRGNALFQCIRLDGVNSMTSDDAHLEKIRALFAAIIAQIGPEYDCRNRRTFFAMRSTFGDAMRPWPP